MAWQVVPDLYSSGSLLRGLEARTSRPDARRRRNCYLVGSSLGYHRVDEVEAKIEAHYKTIALSPGAHERVAALIEQHFARKAATSQQELDRCKALLADLKEQERTLLARDYKSGVSDVPRPEDAPAHQGQAASAS